MCKAFGVTLFFSVSAFFQLLIEAVWCSVLPDVTDTKRQKSTVAFFPFFFFLMAVSTLLIFLEYTSPYEMFSHMRRPVIKLLFCHMVKLQPKTTNGNKSSESVEETCVDSPGVGEGFLTSKRLQLTTKQKKNVDEKSVNVLMNRVKNLMRKWLFIFSFYFFSNSCHFHSSFLYHNWKFT